MKILSISFLIVSTYAFGIDFNKVSGSFDASVEKKSEQVAHVTINTQGFDKNGREFNERIPASLEATAQVQRNSKK